MRTLQDIRVRMEGVWTRHWTLWARGEGQWPIRVPLDAPTHSQARGAWSYFSQWRADWEDPAAPRLEYVTKRWVGLGNQSMPTHAVFSCAQDVASFLGAGRSDLLKSAQQRWRTLISHVPENAALHRIIPWLARVSEQDLERALSVARWLHAHPESGLYLRQLPVSGVDSKWAEGNSKVVSALLSALNSAPTAGRLVGAAGLKADLPKCRFRVLDPVLQAQFAGLSDISTPIDDLALSSLRPQVVIIVENLQTALAFPELDGAIVVFGSGFQVTALKSISWLEATRLVYWGDLDTAGFEILSALRGELPHVESFAMDQATLLAHRPLWGPDPKQRAVKLSHLTPDEQDVYDSLSDARYGQTAVRLEQERIDWSDAWKQLNDFLAHPKPAYANSAP